MARGGARPGAGRPVAAHTIQAEALKKFLIEQVIKEKEPLIAALIRKGKRGDVPALKEIFERVLGKVAQPIANDGDKAFVIQWSSKSHTNREFGRKVSTKVQNAG